MPKSLERRLVSINEAAAYADVNTRTVRRWIAQGHLIGFRAGPRLIRVDRHQLDAMLRPIPTTGGGQTTGGGHDDAA